MSSRVRTAHMLSAATALLLGLTGATSANASPGRLPAADRADLQFDWLRNVNSGQCLAVPGGSMDPGTGLIQWPCSGWMDHKWHLKAAFTAGGIQYFQIMNANSGQCVALPGGSTEAGTQVIQWPCGDWKDHYWGAEFTNQGVRLKNWNSGQCLSIPGGSGTEGERVIQWPCGGWLDQSWRYQSSSAA
ncbi:RICIN domain-containing protein [Streptomyces sp. NPDC005409]|uniref:RICIN domain-containing protein n=1 Tax=Streptomyces sp. NPDC005409 TaxID=3155342 RepID=UPI003453CCDE